MISTWYCKAFFCPQSLHNFPAGASPGVFVDPPAPMKIRFCGYVGHRNGLAFRTFLLRILVSVRELTSALDTHRCYID
jgi:hypothetical protein